MIPEHSENYLCEDNMLTTIEYVTPWRAPLPITTAGSSALAQRMLLLVKRLTTVAGAVGALGVGVLGSSSAAAAAPSGFANFGNAQDAVNALTAAGYNVRINGATVFPLSSCKGYSGRGIEQFQH
jgi:hypothetical protein